MTKKIAVLAWGSLIDNPGTLSSVIDGWNPDGPKLPIEFARKSNDGRLTLIIFSNYKNIKEKWIKTYWSYINTNSTDTAISLLAEREKCSLNKIRLFHSKNDFASEDEILKSINVWALKKEIDVVIWTNLPATFNNEDEILNYISCLRGYVFKKVYKYIFSTPIQTKTYLREKIEKILLDCIAKKLEF
jgi:hypothetical protein